MVYMTHAQFAAKKKEKTNELLRRHVIVQYKTNQSYHGQILQPC